MPISSDDRVAGPFTGNGVQTVYPFDFVAFADTDFDGGVVLTDLNGEETVQTLTTHYTITLNADQDNDPGGDLTMVTAPPSGYLLTFTTEVPNSQAVVITNNGGFFPRVVTRALDKLTVLVQQLVGKINRSINIPLSDGTSLSTTLPTAALRANNFLFFGSDGAPGVTPGAGSSTTIAAAMVPVVQAATLAAGRTAFGAGATGGALFTASTAAGARATLEIPFTPASAASAAKMDFAEDTDNGANKVTVIAPASVAADAVVTLPGATGTLATLAGTEALTNKSVNGVTLTAGGSATQYLNAAGSYVTPVFTQSFTSSNQTITSAGSLTLAHSLGAIPKFVLLELVCVTGEAGFTAGDVVPIPPTSFNTGGSGPVCVYNSTNVLVRFGISASAFNISNFSSGASANLTNGNWQLRVKAWT